MKTTSRRVAGGERGQYRFQLIEWRCCGNLWQLLLSIRYPERQNWQPICPNCRTKGETWVKLRVNQ